MFGQSAGNETANNKVMEVKNTKVLLGVLFVGTLMGALDLAIIGPALPVIQAEFGMQQRQLAGLLNAYVLFQMIGALLLAKMADRFGPRTIYILSIVLFAAGSLALVIADATWVLYTGRAMQGFGAGGIFPAAAAVIGSRLPPEQRGAALGTLGMVWGVAFLAGPILGGILLNFAWQWLFLINLPIAVVLIIGAIKLLPPNGKREPAPFDLEGMITMTVTLVLLVFAVTGIDTNDFGASFASWRVGGGFALVVALTLLFVLLEKRATDPIVQPALFRSSQVSKSCMIATGVGALQAGGIFYPALVVASLGITPANAAWLLIPGVVCSTIASPIIGRLINVVGTRLIVVVGQILLIGSLLIYSFIDLSIVIFLTASIIGGLGTACLVGAPLRFIMLTETGPDDRAAAQGLLSVSASVGRLIGAAIVGAVATSKGGGVAGYQAAFAMMAVLGGGLLLIAVTLKSRNQEQVDTAEAAATA